MTDDAREIRYVLELGAMSFGIGFAACGLVAALVDFAAACGWFVASITCLVMAYILKPADRYAQ